jgi:hypothetical protein
MCSDAGEPIMIPCLECDGTGVDASIPSAPEMLTALTFSVRFERLT